MSKLSGGRVWTASMIAPLCDAGVGTQASCVVSDFENSGSGDPILTISAQGLYRAFINGKRVGDDLLTPGWTCYDDRIAFQTYSIGDLLTQGTNRIEIWLGDGWYRSQMLWYANRILNTWGDRIGAIAEITEGENLILATDGTWQGGLTAVGQNGIYYGEDQDARLTTEIKGGVEVLEFDKSLLVPHETGAVRELAPLEAIETWADDQGRPIYDFGQNAGGFVRLTVHGSAGAKVLVEHSEVVGPEREFDNRNYRSARGAAEYTLSGNGEETFEPMFSFMGFRYARLTITGDATVIGAVFVPISSVPELAGEFTCGEPSVNRLVQNTIWSQRSNFIEVPTDCPQRDERLGWSGDAQVFAGTACWLADSETFLQKYLRDLMHDQRPDGAIAHFSPDPTYAAGVAVFGSQAAGSTGWGDAITVIPWQLYLRYGNTEVLRETFPAMLKWLEYLWNISGGPIIQPEGVGFETKRGFTFGDWLQPIGDNRKPRPTIGDDCAATLYHFISNDIVTKVAALLGDREAETFCKNRANEIKTAFQNEFFTASGRLGYNDQTSYAIAFLYDLVPSQYFEQAKQYFRKTIEVANCVIGTGFIGTPALLPALSKLGMNDLAEKVFLNRSVPGWLYQVENGSTSIWERWDAIGPDGTIYDPEMNSYNHYAYGAVCQWLFEQVAGIAPTVDAPGFDTVLLDPQILPALDPVSAWHDCRHGRIKAGWELDGENVRYSVSLPSGATGRLMPSDDRKNLKLDGADVTVPPEGLVVASGAHEIEFTRN